MGRTVKKHKHKHKVHKKHSHKKPSKFSLFKNKISDTFKEIVEVPEHEEVITEEQVEVNSVPEEIEVSSPTIKFEEEVEETIEEEPRVIDTKRDEILQTLNSAVSKWKETGEIGVHIKAPVSLREKVKGFLANIKKRSTAETPEIGTISEKLEHQMEEVVEKAAEKVVAEKAAGKPVNTEKIVREEWKDVMKKMEQTSTPSEREEIEKIYKELSK